MENHSRTELIRVLLAHYESLIRHFARRFGSTARAADAVQDTYLRLLEHRLSVVRDPQAYLRIVARNVAYDHATRHRRHSSRHEATSEFPDLPSADPLPDAVLHHRRRLERLAAALNDLPSACRTAFILNRMEGMDHAGIAERLGVSRSMVEKHIARALAHCRDRLREGED